VKVAPHRREIRRKQTPAKPGPNNPLAEKTLQWAKYRVKGEPVKILLYLTMVLSMAAPLTAQAKRKGSAPKKPSSQSSYPGLAELKKMTARFAPTEIRVDTTHLSAGDQKALVKLIEAARLFDDLFLTQLWRGNPDLYSRLQKDQSPLGKARLHYFWINKGPWSELDEHRAFLPGVPAQKPTGANFYPERMTKRGFELWVAKLPEKDREQATGFYTVIQDTCTVPSECDLSPKLGMVPYSTAYYSYLKMVARLLHEAVDLTDNASLKKFLNSRADAFLSNDYYQSDLDWMDLDAPLDITIGPYETYNDELFGYKAAFEAYINIRDEQESAKLSFFGQHLQEIENNLPLAPQYRNPKLGAAAPIRVVNEVFSSGDGNHGVQTAAYNLPNDDRVVAEKGSKRVMMKNVQEAKFQQVLIPITRLVLSPQDQRDVSFEAFFTHIVAHELMHGLGPHQITVNGRSTNPRLELKETYGTLEEAKADVTGLFALQYLLDQGQKVGIADGESKETAERRLYTTFLASAFRTLRFGLTESHAKGMAIQMNYIMDKGGFVANADGTFAVDFKKIKGAVRDLDHDLLTLEATGDYAGAKKMMEELSVVRPVMQKAIDGMRDIPTDIEPVFVTASQVTAGKLSAPAEETGLDSVLSQMDASASGFHSAEADLTQEDYQKVVDDRHTEHGKIYFRRTSEGLQMAMDFMSSPDSKYVVLTDNTIRLYQPKIDQVTEYPIGKSRTDVESMFALGFGGRGHDLLKSFDVKLAESEMMDGVKTAKLELTPKTEGLKKYFSRIELWIDAARDVSLQQQFWQPSGDYHLAHYSRIRLNQKIPDDVFKLKTTSHTRTIRP
jgi:outer membrane lipoprotein-sorting protein